MAIDLFLLALSELPGSRPSRQALEAEGIDSDGILAQVRAHGDTASEGNVRLTFAPAFYSVKGRAEGLAAALGDGSITPEHVLVALMWDPMSLSSQVVHRVGASRQRIIDHLRHAGVVVPQAPLPPQREIERGERVWVDRDLVDSVVAYVGRHIPPETVWGFNYEGDRAWLIAESHVEGLVAEALAAQEQGR
jgi:ATP-dependent Clp protease ATP-binding subunit ClpA